MTFVHMMVGLAGAGATLWGSQIECQDKIAGMKFAGCIRTKPKKGKSKSDVERACRAKYTQRGKLGMILKYGGLIGIIGVFILLFFLNSGLSSMFSGMSSMGSGFSQQWQQ